MLDLTPIKTLWNPEDLSQPVSIGQAFEHIAELVEEVERLRELAGYIEHRHWCPASDGDDRNCGLAALEEVEAKEDGNV